MIRENLKKESKMSPTIGMAVVYNQPQVEEGFNGHRDHAAVITDVHSDTLVNLKVFFDCGPVDDRTSVELWNPGDPTKPRKSYWIPLKGEQQPPAG